MYVCTCVCMYVSKYVYIYLWMYACMHVYMYVCMHICTYVCMYVCMYVCICALMCICVCMSIFSVLSIAPLSSRSPSITLKRLLNYETTSSIILPIFSDLRVIINALTVRIG